MFMRNLLFAFVLLSSGVSHAATPYKQTLDGKNNSYLVDGVFTGGKAGAGSTLLGVRRAFSPKAHLERVILDLGDKDAKPAGKNPGYYQASIDAGQKRITLDLAQLRSTTVTEQKLKEIFKKSPYVASVEFTLDPEDKAGTLVLNLKQPTRLEVFQLLDSKKPARIVMDLIPAGK